MSEPSRGLLDTPVVIDYDLIDHHCSIADLLIAATAPANGLPLYTRNPATSKAWRESSR